jgi:ABC-2 type transport system ATP-binding protein
MPPAITTSHLTCRYGRVEAVHDLTLTVEPGTTFALLGPNGAGKTTTIRTLLNIRRPSSGRASVLGIDSRRLTAKAFAAIGYVSENQKLPAWMTVDELLVYCRPFYTTWDQALCENLIARFDLPRTTKIGRLSRGLRVKAALVSSLAYRPQLLVLDEPFSGLDPVVRDDLVHGVLELAGQEQWTVFLSSHDLDEVERLVDTVGFLDGGQLVLCEPFADLHARFRRVVLTVDAADVETKSDGNPFRTTMDHAEDSLQAGTAEMGWIGVQVAGRVVRFVETRYVAGETERRAQAAFAAGRVEAVPMSLREIFVAMARQRRAARR